jgi:hypothetical protein
MNEEVGGVGVKVHSEVEDILCELAALLGLEVVFREWWLTKKMMGKISNRFLF